MGNQATVDEQTLLNNTPPIRVCVSADKAFDLRRLVFISLRGLYQSWQKCPDSSLYSSLIILPFHRKWMLQPKKYTKEIANAGLFEISALGERKSCRTRKILEKFFTLLRFKDSQGLVFWTKDHMKQSIHDSNLFVNGKLPVPIHPMWLALNSKLQHMYDPVTGGLYRGLFELCTTNQLIIPTSADMRDELISANLNRSCCKEIFRLSNSESLIPVVSYDSYLQDDSSLRSPQSVSQSKLQEMFSGLVSQDEVDDWWISEDYC